MNVWKNMVPEGSDNLDPEGRTEVLYHALQVILAGSPVLMPRIQKQPAEL